ncbi:hypothetical protein FKP32DRAFT_1574376, partial [Trametes sanguinea]
MHAQYVVNLHGVLSPNPRRVNRETLDTLFQFKSVVRSSHLRDGLGRLGDLIVTATPARLVSSYNFWRPSLSGPRVLRLEHREGNAPVGDDRESGVENIAHDAHNIDENDTSYLDIASEDLQRRIITEWEQNMCTARLKDDVCAVCGRLTSPNKIEVVDPLRICFEMLQNNDLPEAVRPITYSREEYSGAILHPKGLVHPERRGPIRVCNECKKDICHPTAPRMPRFALANWLYYGHDRLPQSVKKAFQDSTHVERMLVSRARASKVSFKFSELKGHALYGTDPNVSQGCVKGNVAIHPQDATHLTEVLPPSNDVVRDTICAVFVGKTQPTKETIKGLAPVLVRKSRVKTMIDFLTQNNPKYAVSATFSGFSQDNMDALFENSNTGDEDVLCAMEIGHIQVNDAVENATEGYVPSEDSPDSPEDGMLVENVGYVDTQETLALNPRDMAIEAVAHCLRGRTFIKSQAGSRFIPDFENPSLLSWLFPHLDPWGLGGFFDARRERKLSLDQQLKYLLQVEGSPFCRDPNFAFVYYNIRQKKAVFDSVSFRVPASKRSQIIASILRLDVRKLDSLAKSFERNPRYKPTCEEESAILRLLAKVNTVSHDLPGTNGYKLALRNQIRGLIQREGTPTLFVTLNPSDRDHPLVRLYAGEDIVVEDHMRGVEMSRWKRMQLAARNPAACARFFDKMISSFIEVVLRPNREGKGLFG